MNKTLLWNLYKLLSSEDLTKWGTRWNFNYTYFLDEDGTAHGDIVAVWVAAILRIRNLPDYFRENDRVITDFVQNTGMTMEHFRALTHPNVPGIVFEDITPADVARTLYFYLLDTGNKAPDWTWYGRERLGIVPKDSQEFFAGRH